MTRYDREMTEAPDSPLTWTEEGQPRSRLYGDIYFSPEDGLAETRAVFLQGCRLPQAWAGRRRFVVGELGFGTGLNVAALLDLWRRSRPPGGHLHVFTLEAHPITAQEAARALSHWPELAQSADLLTRRWPGGARGMHRIDLPELDATVDVAIGEAAPALAGWTGRADAWFLDGFSPALNPQMWTPEILRLVAERSAPGARVATFTVAGQVRRGLAEAGFTVERQPGFGRKRQRLEAVLPGAPATPKSPRIAIVGGGIAGASLVRAIAAIGGEAELFEAEGLGAGASGNPSALVTPRLDAGQGPPARLFAQVFRRAVQLYLDAPGAVIAKGVLQLAREPRDATRFARIAQSDLFDAGSLTVVEPAAVAQRLGEPASAGLDQAAALVIEPGAILAAWGGGFTAARINALTPGAEGWTLTSGAAAHGPFDAVIVAGGAQARALLPDLPLGVVRGQASWTALAEPGPALAWGGYAAPTRDGLLFGATHDRGDEGVDLRDEDHARNLRSLADRLPRLAARVAGQALSGRAALRAATRDHLPLAGELAGGLYVLGGLGGRGFSFAPLLAEHVAARVLDAPSPLPADLAAPIDPGRFRNGQAATISKGLEGQLPPGRIE